MAMRKEDKPSLRPTPENLQANYTIEDKKNVQNYHIKRLADPNYKMKEYEFESIQRQYGKQV